ncbi:MAG: peptidylprolyl isomerase [Planctomycetota bacterium]
MDVSVVDVDTVVTLNYRLTLADGQAVDSSEESGPLAYLHGRGQIVPGLEEALTGRSVGENLKVTVPAEKGYGLSDPDGVQKIPRQAFPEGTELTPGQGLQAQDEGGQVIRMQVVEVGPEEVTVDLNHPLAGRDLHFEIEVLGVRTPTQEELTHGHAHGPGGDEKH